MRTFIFLSMIVAFWVFLGSTLQWVNILSGILLAAFLFFMMRKSLLARTFVTEGTSWHRPLQIVIAAFRYSWAVIIANVEIASLILHFRSSIRPGILRIHMGEMGDLEQTILANSITLTPGTITVEFSADRQYLYVHVVNVQDITVSREQLRKHVEIHFGDGLRWWKSPSI